MATVATRIGLADHGRRMTIEEFLDAEEETGYRYELARGVLEVTQVPGPSHGQVVCNLYRFVASYDQSHPGVILRWGGGSEFRLWLPAMISGRNPDLAVVLRATPKNLDGDRSPSLVAEVVSRGSVDRDHKAKREEYLAFGIQEYWIIDYLERKMTLLVRNGDAWLERPCPDDQPIPSLVMVGLTAIVSELWTSLEEYDPAEETEG